MGLNFLNQCRSYDATRHRIRFLGHDNMLEVSFSVNAEALLRIEPGAGNGEVGQLRAFDANRAIIEQRAYGIYSRRRKGPYDLTPADF